VSGVGVGVPQGGAVYVTAAQPGVAAAAAYLTAGQHQVSAFAARYSLIKLAIIPTVD
jgi:hypothetical protein